MSEIITIYEKENLDKALPMDRDEFYKEQVDLFKEGEKPTKVVEIVNVLLFNNHGEMYIQKRSDTKAHNAGLLGKSMGGHRSFGNSLDYTVMVETVQELQVPSITLTLEDDFEKTHQLLKDYLVTVAIIKRLDTQIFEMVKKIDGKDIPVLNKVNFYLGIYNGATKTVDREAKGVLLYSLEDLEREMKEFPMNFTNDIKELVKRYRPQILQFIEDIKLNISKSN